MKKIILSLSVCLMVLMLSNCSDQIIEIPDANFKSYLLENFDKNKDGNISSSEAKAVKEINCSGRKINDLTGIQYFVKLENLDCSDNNLYFIEIQKNKKLNKLDCRRNKEGIQVYFSAFSPLKNPYYQNPDAGSTPGAGSMMNPVDNSKCLYDAGTYLVINFDE